LRKNGSSVSEATRYLEGKSVADKNQFLFEHGINYNNLPAWQKRGVGFLYTSSEVSTSGPEPYKAMPASRKQLDMEMTLPLGTEYESLIRKLLANSNND
jgi:tRNA(His) guanylyltransferase